MGGSRPVTKPSLPNTLAQRVQWLRLQRQLTVSQLAQKALLTIHLLEEIEAGIQLFLSPVERQRLARVLKVPTQTLLDVEKPPEMVGHSAVVEENISSDTQEVLLFRILQKPDASYDCPQCQQPLIVRQFQRLDVNDQPVTVLKIHCSQCLFRLNHG